MIENFQAIFTKIVDDEEKCTRKVSINISQPIKIVNLFIYNIVKYNVRNKPAHDCQAAHMPHFADKLAPCVK